jgi:diadenosine tetraphosphatase ApaH/serine/threonine PP2A family protein phosphatase
LRYLILSDLHANLQALDAVLQDASGVGYDQVVVLGDLVGYGADPGGVIDRTSALEPVALIRGNHDKVCAGLETPALFNDAARLSVEWTRRVLSPRHLEILAALPKGPHQLADGITICHGTPFDEDFYLLDPRDAERAAASSTGTLCLFGHTHVPTAFVVTRSGTESVKPQGEIAQSFGRRLINVGSVGQPRDGDARAAYGVVDTSTNAVIFRRVEYDVEAAQARIRRVGLPHWLADRLEIGR